MIKRSSFILSLTQHTSKFFQGPINYSVISSHNQHDNLISLLQSCEQASQTAQIHGLMLKIGLDKIPFPLSKLLAHVSAQDFRYASSIFTHIETPNLYMFNTMLRGHSVDGDPQKGLILFNRMRKQYTFTLDQFTFVSVLKCCSRLMEVVEVRAGLEVHSAVLKSGFDLFLNVENALMHLYSIRGRIEDAQQVFDELSERRDLVSWNTLMGGYLRVAQHDSVLHLLKQFLRIHGFCVSPSTVVNALTAELRDASVGKCLHAVCLKVGFLSNLNVLTSLISLYSKTGEIHHARLIFNEINISKDVVLWNCLIDGYAKLNLLNEALELLNLMKLDRVKPNSSTFASLLSAGGGLKLGEYIHNYYIKEQNVRLDEVLGTALVNMYAKNGRFEKAADIFDKMESKDIKCWTTMISSCGAHGESRRAVEVFERMEEEGLRPNEVSFLAVLSACSHGGLVEEGIRCLKRMVEVYGLEPRIEHYGCVVDMLGRVGLLEEAYGVIEGLKIEDDGIGWRGLLGACRVYGDVDLAKRVRGVLGEIGEECASDGIVLAGAYVAAGMLPCCNDTDTRVSDQGRWCKKEAGCSRIE